MYRVCNSANARGAGGGGSVAAGADERLQESCVHCRNRGEAVVPRGQQNLVHDIDVRLAHLRQRQTSASDKPETFRCVRRVWRLIWCHLYRLKEDAAVAQCQQTAL